MRIELRDEVWSLLLGPVPFLGFSSSSALWFYALA